MEWLPYTMTSQVCNTYLMTVIKYWYKEMKQFTCMLQSTVFNYLWPVNQHMYWAPIQEHGNEYMHLRYLYPVSDDGIEAFPYQVVATEVVMESWPLIDDGIIQLHFTSKYWVLYRVARYKGDCFCCELKPSYLDSSYFTSSVFVACQK